MKKGKKSNTPPRKRLTRNQRISAAEKWLKSYTGKYVVKGYSNWFGVDLHCAIRELRILGYKISEEYELQVRKSLNVKILRGKKAEDTNQPMGIENEYVSDWENDFEFIAGYTSNGIPFGTRKDGSSDDES